MSNAPQTPQTTTTAPPTNGTTPQPQPKPAPLAVVPPSATSNALARSISDDSFKLALEPNDFNGAYKLAQVAAAVRLCGVTSPEDALTRILTGRVLGIPAFTALRSVYVVEGRPSLSAALKVALCLHHADCEYFELVETTNERATYKAKRIGQDEKRVTFTIDDARRAELVKPHSNWEKWPAPMCRARASSQLADILFPDATNGFMTRDEAEDEARAERERVDEMTGEVISGPANMRLATEPGPAAVPREPPPPQAAPPRDLDSEAALLKHRIANAQTDEDKKKVRADVAKFVKELGKANPWADDVAKFYNMTIGGPTGKQHETAAAGAAPAQGTLPTGGGQS